jgi:tetratricopeptide (TPR) repeat protein
MILRAHLAMPLLAALLPLAASPQQPAAAAVGSEPPAAGESATALRDALAELERSYASAVAAHAAGEFEASIVKLRAVVEALEALPEGSEPFAQWTRTMLRLARSEQELGRRVEAKAILERLLRAAPDAKADPRQFPPSFLALIAEARAARQRALDAERLAGRPPTEPRPAVEAQAPRPVLSLIPEPAAAARAPHGAPARVLGDVPSVATARDTRYGWTAVGTGAATVLAAGASVYFGLAASGSYEDARAMLDGNDRLRPGLSVYEYNAAIRDGDRSRSAAVGAGIAAGVGLSVTAILSWVSYRRTGEIGPLRF